MTSRATSTANARAGSRASISSGVMGSSALGTTTGEDRDHITYAVVNDDAFRHIPTPFRAKIVDVPMKRLAPYLDDLVRRYGAGASTYDLAREFGLSPIGAWRVLRRTGILRSRSEASILRRRDHPEEVRCLRGAGGTVRKGKRRSYEDRCRRAKPRESRLSVQHPSERLLVELLETRGLHGVPQLAIGPYNCAFATG